MVRVLLSPRWLALHLLTVALVALFLRLGWWQYKRAEQGNTLSIGYALEWPAFAVFVVLVWGHLVRDALRAHRGAQPAPDSSEAADAAQAVQGALLPPDPALTAARARAGDDQDEELAAYNDYLARLNAADSRRKRS